MLSPQVTFLVEVADWVFHSVQWISRSGRAELATISCTLRIVSVKNSPASCGLPSRSVHSTYSSCGYKWVETKSSRISRRVQWSIMSWIQCALEEAGPPTGSCESTRLSARAEASYNCQYSSCVPLQNPERLGSFQTSKYQRRTSSRP